MGPIIAVAWLIVAAIEGQTKTWGWSSQPLRTDWGIYTWETRGDNRWLLEVGTTRPCSFSWPS